MQKQYRALGEDRVYFGVASDIQHIADDEKIDVVADLREESTGCAASNTGLTWKQIPLEDNADQPRAELFGDTIQPVVSACHKGRKVAFHCGGDTTAGCHWRIPPRSHSTDIQIANRIRLFMSLPIEKIDRIPLQTKLRELGQQRDA